MFVYRKKNVKSVWALQNTFYDKKILEIRNKKIHNDNFFSSKFIVA